MYKESLSNVRWGLQHETAWQPPTDVYETDDRAVVIVEIAGLLEDQYEISLTDRRLVISGERCDPAEKLAYQQMEIRYGKFRTEIYLPWAVDSSAVEASYQHGFLKVSLRKAQAKRVPIRVVQNMEG